MATKNPTWLREFSSNTYSQRGEDGILEKIVSMIPNVEKWCVEFGAWDGTHLSNTRLLMDKGWSGVFIEGGSARFKDLEATYKENPRAHCVLGMVGWEGDEKLDAILGKTPIPKRFGLLSIDIDSNDYHVWEALQKYRPQIVVIEYNPTIPPHIDFVQPRSHAVNQGNSLRAVVRLAKEKGYELIATTSLNAIFVEKEYFGLFDIADNSPETMYNGHDNLMTCFQLYDGTMVFQCPKGIMLFWHGVLLPRYRLPRPFRMFPERMGPVRLTLFRMWRRVHNAYVTYIKPPQAI